MKLRRNDIAEYREIYLHEHGISLSDEEAEKQANKMFVFMKQVFNLTNN